MRTIDATLEAALPTAAGTFIAKVQFKRGATTETITQLTGYEINEGELTAWVRLPLVYKPTIVNVQTNNDTIFQISRGLNILGVDYYLASSWFIVQKTILTDTEVIYQGHIFKSIRHTTAGDVSVQTVIDDVIANSYVSGLGYTNTISYPSSATWWKTINFYPAGKSLTLQKLEKLNSVLRQKYILDLFDIGGNTLVTYDNGQINRYEPIDTPITPITSIISMKIEGKSLPQRYFIWKDEAAATHTSGASTSPLHNLGYIESTVTPYSLGEYSNAFITAELVPPDLRLTAEDYIFVTSPGGEAGYSWFKIKEVFDTTNKNPWKQTLESIRMLSNTEGGSIPSTLERSSPYTPLNTGNFNNNLDSTVNNLQALAEAVDDLPLGGGAPATTAANDFQVGDGAGAWIKKTLAETKTILGTEPGGSDTNIQYNDGGAFGGAKIEYTDNASTINLSAEDETTPDTGGKTWGFYGSDGKGTGDGGVLQYSAGNTEGGEDAATFILYGGKYTGAANDSVFNGAYSLDDGGGGFTFNGVNGSGNGNGGGHIFKVGAGAGSGVPGNIKFRDPSNVNAIIDIAGSELTTDRTFTFPDKDGTFAMLSDIPIVIPFGVYTSVNPSTATATLYTASILRNLTLTAWRQSFVPSTPNSGSDYWTVALIDAAGTTFASFLTKDGSPTASAWNYTDVTISTASVTANTSKILYIRATKSGSAGALYLAGPWVEATRT